MVLSARVVKNLKGKTHYCSDCRRPITGMFITAYGMADAGDMPFSIDCHVDCFPYSKDTKVVQAKRAAAHLLEHPEATIKAAFAAAKGEAS
jgi:hypothetical protein